MKEFILPRQKGVRAVKLFVEILKASALVLKYLAEVIRAITELIRSTKN